jgi:hypothetical protein
VRGRFPGWGMGFGHNECYEGSAARNTVRNASGVGKYYFSQ